jgi:hypothetical protein
MIGEWQGGHRSMKHTSRCTKQGKHPKTHLRLPDLEFSKAAVLNSLSSADGQRGYSHAIDEFVDLVLLGAATGPEQNGGPCAIAAT